jgi:hypothetical protein
MNIETGNAVRLRVIVTAGIYGGLAALVFFFAFCNLDGRLFWGDEAETAVLARNILKFGVPKVDDGVTHLSLHGDSFDTRNSVWTWSPWLPEYVTAASFAVFGQTTWAGRAPFAAIGWLAVMLLGFIAWKIYQSHRIALSAMLLLGTSEVFLLHIRQCRYYSLTVLAEIILVFGIYQILAKNKNGSWFILAALLLQFYCNYAIAAANVPALLVLAWKLFQQKRNSALPLLLALGIWLLLSVPWLLYAEVWREGSAEGHDTWANLLYFYAWQFHLHFFPWCVVLLPLSGWLFHRFSRDTKSPQTENSHYLNMTQRFEKYLVLLAVLYVPVLLVMPTAFSRYLLPLLPIACLLVAAWLFRYIRWPSVAITLLFVQCVSNVFAVATDPFARQYPLRSPLADFTFSNLLPYDDRLSDALKFFKEQAHPGDVLVSWDPEFPLVFYTPLTVENAWFPLPPSHRLPDWILPKSLTGDVIEKPFEMPDVLKPYYEKMTLTVHDSTQMDNIPEPEAFQHETAKSPAPFVIYKLKTSPTPPETSLPTLLQCFLVPNSNHSAN